VDGEGRGLSDALVLARSESSAHWTRTGADGSFDLSDTPQGPLEVTAWLLGFATASRTVDGPQAELELRLARPAVEPGSPLPELAGAPLSGLVQACMPDQALPARHEVLLVPRDGPQSVQGAVLEATTTDTEGRFTFERVAFGTYDLQVLPDWARGGSWPDLTGEGPFWIEHLTGGTDSPPVPLACGAILARLFDDAEDPVEGALVLLHLEGAPGVLWPPTTTGPDGRFEFLELPVGNYELEVRAGESSLLGVRARVEAGRVTQPDLPPIAPRQSPGDGLGPR
jgi:hypothetical protein